MPTRFNASCRPVQPLQPVADGNCQLEEYSEFGPCLAPVLDVCGDDIGQLLIEGHGQRCIIIDGLHKIRRAVGKHYVIDLSDPCVHKRLLLYTRPLSSRASHKQKTSSGRNVGWPFVHL